MSSGKLKESFLIQPSSPILTCENETEYHNYGTQNAFENQIPEQMEIDVNNNNEPSLSPYPNNNPANISGANQRQ